MTAELRLLGYGAVLVAVFVVMFLAGRHLRDGDGGSVPADAGAGGHAKHASDAPHGQAFRERTAPFTMEVER